MTSIMPAVAATSATHRMTRPRHHPGFGGRWVVTGR